MTMEPQTEIVVDIPNLNKVRVIILKVNSFMGVEKPYELSIMGRTMLDWVKRASSTFATKEIDYLDGGDLIKTIKPHLQNEDYTVVLYSDTPLLKKKTIDDIVDYAVTKGVSVCKLQRGFVFKTEYIKTAKEVCSCEPNFFDEEDFIVVNNYQNLSVVENILRKRIIQTHLNNGVRIIDTNSVSIDAEVVIRNGTTIYPNNRIFGICLIEENVTLEPNNVIFSSIIGKGSKVICSVIRNAKVPKNSEIGPFKNI